MENNSIDFKIGIIYGYAFCKAQKIVEDNGDYRFLDDETKLEITKNIANEIIGGAFEKGDEW